MNSRHNILQRLRQYRTSMPAHEQMENPTAGVVEVENKVGAFTAAMEAAHGEVIPTTSEHWRRDLFEHLRAQAIHNLMIADQSRFADLLLQENTGIELLPYNQAFESMKDDLFHRVAAGFSVASAGIAETGTLIVKSGPGEPRTLSLVPPVNYVWLDANTLYQNQFEAFADKEYMKPLPTNLLLISGPSKTADIQQTLAYGAHGPKRLIVLLIDG
ncbi:hypothetical protein BTA51_18940 [Hahella sp. CCB-MM4]|nr:hypothetical protein BTA51_18940 [Hahella sp. CCB-MM4]